MTIGAGVANSTQGALLKHRKSVYRKTFSMKKKRRTEINSFTQEFRQYQQSHENKSLDNKKTEISKNTKTEHARTERYGQRWVSTSEIKGYVMMYLLAFSCFCSILRFRDFRFSHSTVTKIHWHASVTAKLFGKYNRISENMHISKVLRKVNFQSL